MQAKLDRPIPWAIPRRATSIHTSVFSALQFKKKHFWDGVRITEPPLPFYSFRDNTAVFTPEPNEDKVTSCMDNIADWIAERHPLDTRRMELFKLPQEQGEGMVAYSNRILDIAMSVISTTSHNRRSWQWSSSHIVAPPNSGRSYDTTALG